MVQYEIQMTSSATRRKKPKTRKRHNILVLVKSIVIVVSGYSAITVIAYRKMQQGTIVDEVSHHATHDEQKLEKAD